MQKQKYIGTSPLIWVVLIVLAFVVVGQFREARNEATAAKQSCIQTTCKEVN